MPDYIAVPGPAHIHPFADVVAGDDYIFVTGLAHPGDTVTEQVEGSFRLIAERLEQVGSSWEEVVHVRLAVTDRAHVQEMNATLRRLLPSPAPAAGALLITPLVAPELMVEMEVTARRGARLIAAD